MSFALTIFISSFFLFQIQPVIARYILPWYGGSPTVWSTCMLFFQLGLLVGYIYAHLLARYLKQHQQVLLHAALLLLSLLLLPITPDPMLKPTGDEDPMWGIIRLLLLTVGVPYVLISSTGPLLQHWYQLKYADRSPYRLYALSNLASLLGLLSYPFLVEPNMALGSQTFFWSCGYLAFLVACLWSGASLFLGKKNRIPVSTSEKSVNTPTEEQAPTRPLLWLGLSACASVLFLAVTSKSTQDISVIPFLWIVPLSLYLCTLIIAFDSPRWYRRRLWIPALLLSCALLTYLLDPYTDLHILWTIFGYNLALFCIIMVCHGELARSKPPTGQLTYFYLMTSSGGALGGIFVNFVATKIFPAYWELQVGIGAAFFLVGFALFRLFEKKTKRWHRPSQWAWAVYAFVILCFLFAGMREMEEDALTTRRNFYGVLRVYEQDKGEESHRRKLYNGQINHGLQLLHPSQQDRIVSYYSDNSGLGLAFRYHPKRQSFADVGKSEQSHSNLRVGVIGLGIGVIASWGKPSDSFRFYEINPEVAQVADEFFTVLKQSKSATEVIIGDGRISLERELAAQGSMQFDILAVDAFSSDAIPVHLLTQEAFELYFKHLRPNGILILHISNRHINLKPVVYGMSQRMEVPALRIKQQRQPEEFIKGSEWVLMTQNQNFLGTPEVSHAIKPWPADIRDDIIWTDDYSSLANILK